MKTALIISLNFNPGHVSHMVASYKQCEEIGYKASYFVDPAFADYLPEDGNILKNGIEDVYKRQPYDSSTKQRLVCQRYLSGQKRYPDTHAIQLFLQ